VTTTAPTPLVVTCPSCGAKNRVTEAKRRQKGVIVCGRCKAPLQTAAGPIHPVVVTDATFTAEIEQSPRPVLLDLWAPWCGPCRTLAPVIEELAQELAGRVKVAKLNVDENPATAARYGVQSIPTLLVLEHGRVVDTLVGAQPKAAILARLARV
jgi:thioredoxin 2